MNTIPVVAAQVLSHNRTWWSGLWLVLAALLLVSCSGAATIQLSPSPEPKAANPAEALLQRSLAYHDPGNVWRRQAVRVNLKSSDPKGAVSTASILIDPAAGLYSADMNRRGDRVEIEARGNSYRASVNGSDEMPDAMRDKHSLDDAGMRDWRNYHEYLLGLPMKLTDPGARLDSAPASARLDGRDVLALRVTYDPAVGGDTWYFYFDPATARLVGCRFFHDEAKNDGEYILFDQEISDAGLRLPRIRRWYLNSDDSFVGTDALESLQVGTL